MERRKNNKKEETGNIKKREICFYQKSNLDFQVSKRNINQQIFVIHTKRRKPRPI